MYVDIASFNMMQWTDSNLSAYNNSPPCKQEACSTVNTTNTTSSTINNISAHLDLQRQNITEAKRETAAVTSLGNSAAVDHLQSCLSMLPQSCSFCGVHPLQWGREEVQQWLKWCISEFSFTDVQTEKFAMNGKALILLKRQDFVERAPSAGDVLYNILQKLLETQTKSASMAPLSAANVAEQAVMLNLMMAANNPFFAHGFVPGFPPLAFSGGLSRSSLPVTPPATGSPRQSTEQPVTSTLSDSVNSRHVISRSHSQSPGEIKHSLHPSELTYASHMRGSDGDTKSLPMGVGASLSSLAMAGESVIQPNPSFPIRKEESIDMISASPRAKSDCRLLWEFISKLLKDSNYTEYIKWENISDYTFRIVNPAQLSRLWGIQKNRTNMTYEKLSRALRYYYRMDIIEKVPGRRLTYRFMRPPHEIKRGQRGAKPGVPRKSRSTDEETEELEEVEAMEAIESELSDDDNRLPSSDYSTPSSIGQSTGFFPPPNKEARIDSAHPIDLVRHQRLPVYRSANEPNDLSAAVKTEALMSQLNAARTNASSMSALIKPELPDWTSASTNNNHTSTHMPGE